MKTYHVWFSYEPTSKEKIQADDIYQAIETFACNHNTTADDYISASVTE